MNIFISWSGDRSKRVAEALATFLNDMLHRVRQSWQIAAMFVLVAAVTLPTASVLTAYEGSADSEAAAGSKHAAAPASDDAAKARGKSIAPKAHESSGKALSQKPEGDKRLPAAQTYTGRVTDKLTGKPIAGASVTVLRRVSSRVIRFSDWRNLGETKHQTDADGQFTFTIPPEQAAEDRLYVSVTVTHPDYLREGNACYFETFRKHETFRQGRLFDKLTMEPAGEISGTVVTPDGKPAKGVPVKAVATPGKRNVNGMSWEDATTNEAGFFQLKVKKGGEAVLWIIPEDYSPSTHVLHAKRGDLGRFVLAKGLVLKGRVVDIDGKPLKNVWVNAELQGGPAKQRYEMPVFDYVARSALSDDQGRFSLAPLPAGDYDLIMAGEPRHRGGKGVVHPLPAVFIDRTIKIDQDVSTRPIEIRAVPHVLIAGQFFDSSGKPTTGHAPELFARNANDGMRAWFGDKARNDEQGKFSVRSPKGFTATLDIMDNDQHVLRIRTSRNGPLRHGRELDLGVPERDMTEVTVIRYVAPILLVKAVGEDGQPVDKFQLRVTYRSPGVAEGDQYYREGKPNGYVGFTRQADGRQRSRQLLPDEEFTLTVEAEGFEPKSEKLKLPEGAIRELEVRLKKTPKPRTPTKESSQTSPEKPPAKPVATTPRMKREGPGRTIAGRTIDAVTGKPVAGAVVKILVRQIKDEKGESSYRGLETDTTTADPQGQFTVFVPQAYLTDLDSKREIDLFVTASHPKHVTGYGFGKPREIAREGVTDTSADFRLLKLEPAKEIYGQAVDAKGRPLAKTPIYKSYFDARDGNRELWQTRDADNPIETDGEGRFRTKVVARLAVKLEFRAPDTARNYVSVPLDCADLGVVRIADGVQVSGRVVDAQGRPVRRILVTAPLQSKTKSQPDFCYYTDEDGRFQTDKLSPGNYLLTVGEVYGSRGGVSLPIAGAPGVYVPLPLKIHAGEPVAEVTLRPTQDVVRCVATLVNTRPSPTNWAGEKNELTLEELGKALAESYFYMPSIAVRGLEHGIAWEARKPEIRGVAADDEIGKTNEGSRKVENPCTLYMPKGLADVTMTFVGGPQHFQLDEKSPKLFGFGIHLDRIDRDLPGIKLYRYRETTLKVRVAGPEGKMPGNVRVEAHYVREKAVRDAGAILVAGSGPFLKPEGKDGNVNYSVLPGEEIEVSAAAPGRKTAVARVQLKDGEVRELRMTLVVVP